MEEEKLWKIVFDQREREIKKELTELKKILGTYTSDELDAHCLLEGDVSKWVAKSHSLETDLKEKNHTKKMLSYVDLSFLCDKFHLEYFGNLLLYKGHFGKKNIEKVKKFTERRNLEEHIYGAGRILAPSGSPREKTYILVDGKDELVDFNIEHPIYRSILGFLTTMDSFLLKCVVLIVGFAQLFVFDGGGSWMAGILGPTFIISIYYLSTKCKGHGILAAWFEATILWTCVALSIAISVTVFLK